MPRFVTHPQTTAPAHAMAPGSAPLSGDDLVRAAQAGRMEAWAALYQQHYAAVFRHTRYLAGAGASVEDLVQEVFARALVALADFDGRSAFGTWLHGIAVNVVRNHWRSQRSTQTAHDRLRDMTTVAPAPSTVDVDRVHMAKRKAEALYAVLETLPDHLREAFVLRDLEGLSPAEGAAQLGITPGNLSVRATRARERIRRELESRGWLAPIANGGGQ